VHARQLTYCMPPLNLGQKKCNSSSPQIEIDDEGKYDDSFKKHGLKWNDKPKRLRQTCIGFGFTSLQRTVAAFFFFTVCLWGLDHPSLSTLLPFIWVSQNFMSRYYLYSNLEQTGLHFCIFIAMPFLDLEFDFLPPWGLLSKFETLNGMIDPRNELGMN
jgi:hypothetical protein